MSYPLANQRYLQPHKREQVMVFGGLWKTSEHQIFTAETNSFTTANAVEAWNQTFPIYNTGPF